MQLNSMRLLQEAKSLKLLTLAETTGNNWYTGNFTEARLAQFAEARRDVVVRLVAA